jgi:hypothetical protein
MRRREQGQQEQLAAHGMEDREDHEAPQNRAEAGLEGREGFGKDALRSFDKIT